MKEKDGRRLEEIQVRDGTTNASRADRDNMQQNSTCKPFPCLPLTMPVKPWGARRSMPPAEAKAFLRTA